MFPVKALMKLQDQLDQYPQSAFGAVRKHDVHTGVDIYCKDGAAVHPIMDGIVVAFGYFTGEKVGSPWWNNTQYIVIKSGAWYILYGEICLNGNTKLGQFVKSTGFLKSTLGRVKRVLIGPPEKAFANPTSMLHIEAYDEPVFAPIWKLDQPKPMSLVDITSQLLAHDV